MDTNTVTPALMLGGSSTATRRLMMPASSSFWMRRQHGVVDNPTSLPTSATERVQSSCRMRSIFTSISSSMAVPLRDRDEAIDTTWNIFLFVRGYGA